jgi:hypothetical protein
MNFFPVQQSVANDLSAMQSFFNIFKIFNSDYKTITIPHPMRKGARK